MSQELVDFLHKRIKLAREDFLESTPETFEEFKYQQGYYNGTTNALEVVLDEIKDMRNDGTI